jgi:PTH1 family peptidyl-tRNA hydrolase
MALKGPHIIVGLGNPGREYERTRHNAGFDVVDALAKELGASYWKVVSNTMMAEVGLLDEKIMLVKPQAYMNLSGGPLKGLFGRYGLRIEDMLVIHDELDLPAGTIRLKLGGGHAGHRGLRSTHQSLGPDYARLRIGIGRPPGRMPAHAFVLQKMAGKEFEEYEVTVAQAVPIVRMVVEDGLKMAMNHTNRTSKTDDDDEPQEPDQ